MTRAPQLFRLQLGLAVAGTLIAVAAGAVVFTRVDVAMPSSSELLAACRQLSPFDSRPELLIVLILGATTAAVAALGLTSIARQLVAQARFRRRLKPLGEIALDGVSVTVIGGYAATAFCAGLLRPRIYLSRPALELLTARELAAVIAHESHHQRRSDPLRILVARTLADALFFLPVLGRVSDRYRELAEHAADDAAAAERGSPALASALLRIDESRRGIAAVAGISPERVEHLLGKTPTWRPPPRVIAGSLLAAAVLVGLAIAAIRLTSSNELTLSALVAQGCMTIMAVTPAAIGGASLWVSRLWIQRHLVVR